MIWLLVALVMAALFVGAWWLSGRARPNNRPDAHANIRNLQGQVDDIHMFRRPGRD